MKDANQNRHVVLIGAGEMGNVIPRIEEKDYVIALDGGLIFCEENGIQPDLIVGDFDSLEQNIAKGRGMSEAQNVSKAQELLSYYPQEMIQRLPCEKDDTDTLAAIRIAVKMGYTSFTIYGGLGGRLSHTMANIQTLLYLKELGMQGELVGDRCRIIMIKDERVTLPPEENGYISVFSYSEKAEGVSLQNLKYEIDNASLTNSFPIGVSNEFVGKTAEISVEEGVLLVVIEL